MQARFHDSKTTKHNSRQNLRRCNFISSFPKAPRASPFHFHFFVLYSLQIFIYLFYIPTSHHPISIYLFYIPCNFHHTVFSSLFSYLLHCVSSSSFFFSLTCIFHTMHFLYFNSLQLHIQFLI